MKKKKFLIIFVIGFAFISLAGAGDLTQEAKITPPVQESKDSTSPVRNTELGGLSKISNGTRIIVTTSGPAKFSSHWLDNPPRLAVEFQTKNIVSSIGSELAVNEGVIKRITSEYYGGTKKNLKSLTFELLEKAPYKIWQEDNNIILDIHTSLTIPLGSEGKEVFVKDESRQQIDRRLETMETVLKQLPAAQVQTEPPKLIARTSPPEKKTTASIALWLMAAAIGGRTIALWLIGLTLISSVGLLAWLFWRRYKLILDKNAAAREIEKLKSQVTEKNKLLEQEETIRKAIEDASRTKEKEFEQLKTELQEEKQVLGQEQEARKIAEEGLLQKEKEAIEVKGSLESLKEALVGKGIAKKLTTAEKEGELWISGKSEERRELPRLDLSKDYNRTIILRIESADRSKSIKSFANNIGLGGLCFESRTEFKEKEAVNLRLFFFGEKVPMMRIRAKLIWSRADSPVNHYGISFVSLEEKDKTELNRYIESKIITRL